jgi:nucleotide-binding universal stress UspA family protein
MKNVLLAVDNTKGALKAAETLVKLFHCAKPETVTLLHVQKIEGHSLMDEALLSVGEMETLKESLKGTDYQERLDQSTKKLIDHFRKILEENGITGIKTVIQEGHPAEEILEAVKREGAEMIILGSRGSRTFNFFMGSVSREVANRAEVPVLIAK